MYQYILFAHGGPPVQNPVSLKKFCSDRKVTIRSTGIKMGVNVTVTIRISFRMKLSSVRNFFQLDFFPLGLNRLNDEKKAITHHVLFRRCTSRLALSRQQLVK